MKQENMDETGYVELRADEAPEAEREFSRPVRVAPTIKKVMKKKPQKAAPRAPLAPKSKSVSKDSFMRAEKDEDIAIDGKGGTLFLLRVLIGCIFLYHGVPKILNISGAMDAFVGMGFPGFAGPLVGLAEIVAGVLLIIGIWHFWASSLLAVIIAIAIVAVQLPGSITTGGVSTGLERDVMLLIGLLVLAFHGAGSYALKSE